MALAPRFAPAAPAAAHHIRTNMQEPDTTDESSPWVDPVAISNKAGIAFPDLQWPPGIPSGSQVCASSDDAVARICCKGEMDRYKQRTMCLVDEGDGPAQDFYDCISEKTMIDGPYGVGLACEYSETERLFITRDGIARTTPKNMTGGSFTVVDSGAGRLGTVGVGVVVLAIVAALGA